MRISAPAVRASEAVGKRLVYSGDVALAVIANLDVIILLIHRQMENLLPVAPDIALDPWVFGERNVRE